VTSNSSASVALTLSLICSTIDPLDIVHVDHIKGEEEISKPYTFEVSFTTSASLTASNIVGQTMQVIIQADGTANNQLTATGIVFALISHDQTITSNFVYRAIVKPCLSGLDLNSRNQVFGTDNPLTIADLIGNLLNGSLNKASQYPSSWSVIDCDTSFINGTNYPARDQIIQYGESDLAFLQRRCELEGVFYYFKQGTASNGTANEQVVFGDDNNAFTRCDTLDNSLDPNGETLNYSTAVTVARAAPQTVVSFNGVTQILPGQLYLRNYSANNPGSDLTSSKTAISSQGSANYILYGENYTSIDEANRLAKIRAQEIACRGQIYRGISTAAQLRPGYMFKLTSTPGVEYIVVKITHRAGRPIGYGHDSGVLDESYHNEFEAIPSTVDFRPQRLTPQPVAAGLFNAKIESATVDNERADIDQYGRYKLRLFYDESTSNAGSGSAYVRKASPYSGKDSGMDFPLVKDTEVVLSFVNGDPDRPIIVGAAPNATLKDVVTSTNHTRNVIKTTSEVLFEIEDGVAPAASTRPNNFARLSVPGTVTSYLRLGIQADGDAGTPTQNSQTPSWGTGLTPTSTTVSVLGATEDQVVANVAVTSLSALDTETADLAVAQSVYDEKHSTINVKTTADYTDGVILGTAQNLITNVGNAALTLVGGGLTTQVTTRDHTTNVMAGAFNVNAQEGVYLTAGINTINSVTNNNPTPTNIVLEAYGYVKTISHGNEYVWSKSDSYTLIDANKYQTVKGNYESTTMGYSQSTIMGYNQSTILGLSSTFILGGRLQMYLGAGLLMSLASDVKILCPGEAKIVLGADCKIILGSMDFKLVYGAYDMKIVSNDIKIVMGTTAEIQPNKLDLATMDTSLKNIRMIKNNLHIRAADIKTNIGTTKLTNSESFVELVTTKVTV
jgi:type VI secretion system secreted protein VgrG